MRRHLYSISSSSKLGNTNIHPKSFKNSEFIHIHNRSTSSFVFRQKNIEASHGHSHSPIDIFVPKSCLVSSVPDDVEKINNVRFHDHFKLRGPISVAKFSNISNIGELKSRVQDGS